MLELHVWVFALVMAALAPWFVQLYVRLLEARALRRTESLLARAMQQSEGANVQRDEP